MATLRGPGRVLEGSARRVCDRVASRGSQRAIWDDFGSILDGVWSMFGVWIMEPGLGILKETSQVLLHVDEVALRN